MTTYGPQLILTINIIIFCVSLLKKTWIPSLVSAELKSRLRITSNRHGNADLISFSI